LTGRRQSAFHPDARLTTHAVTAAFPAVW
jgi:hypothetical protein